MDKLRRVVCVAFMAAGVSAADAGTAASAGWQTSPGVSFDGDIMTCVSKGEQATAWASRKLDLSDFNGEAFRMSVRCRGRGVVCGSGGAFKAMVQFDDAATGRRTWPQADGREGSWDWQEVSFTCSLKGLQATNAVAYLGLQRAKGEVDFDLSTLRVEKCDPDDGKPIKVAFIGNSITRHPPNKGLGWTNDWGMAASAAEKDYVHLVARGLEKQTGRKAAPMIFGSGALEREYRDWEKTCDVLQGVVSNRPEIVVLAYGENANDLTNDVNAAAYERTYRRAVRMMKDVGARVVIRTSFWAKPRQHEMMQRIAREENVLIADCSDLGQKPEMRADGRFRHGGVAFHPYDPGMAVLADRILAALAPRKISYPARMAKWPRMLKGAMLPGEPREKDFADLAAMGATLVRYQMVGRGWKQHRVPGGRERYDAWVDDRLDLLERMLPWGRKYGIRICVDNHYIPAGNTTEKHAGSLMFQDSSYCDWVVDMWRKTARRMKGNWDVLYGYDVINESMDRESAGYETCWRALFTRCCDVIRAEDPEATLVIEPNCHASPYGFEVKSRYGLRGFAQLPYDNAIYQVHMYMPLEFTHQGLFENPDKYRPVAYPDPAKGWTKDWLREQLKAVRAFQLATGARIHVGEFSAAAYAPGAAQYLRDVTDIFREYGWDWTYHAFRESNCWSIEHEGRSFHELRPAKAETDRAKVIKAALGN